MRSSNWSEQRGYVAAQDQVTTYLSDRDWRPLAKLLAERLASFDPAKAVVFLTRVAAMAPGHLPHVEAARRDAGQDPCDDDPVLPRLDRRARPACDSWTSRTGTPWAIIGSRSTAETGEP